MDFSNDLSQIRRAGIRFFTSLINLIWGTKITDITSGFKIYKVSSLKKLHKPSDINPAVEQMAEMAKKGFKIGEVPIQSPNRKEGKSHLSFSKFVFYPIRACFQILKVGLFY